MEALRSDITAFVEKYCPYIMRKDQQSKAMQISEPFNFRREDVTLPGLSDTEQAWIREKAVTDASRMNLRPLAPVADDTRPKFAFYPFASASLTNIRTPREIPSAHYHTLQRHKSYDNVLEKTPHRSVFNGDEYSFHSPRGDALLRKISDGLLSSRTSSTQALSPTAYASQPSLPYRNHSFADLPPDVRKNSWRGSRFGDDELGMEDGMGWRGIFGRA